MGRLYPGPDGLEPAAPDPEDAQYDRALGAFFLACIRRYGPMPVGACITVHVLKPDPGNTPVLFTEFFIPGGNDYASQN